MLHTTTRHCQDAVITTFLNHAYKLPPPPSYPMHHITYTARHAQRQTHSCTHFLQRISRRRFDFNPVAKRLVASIASIKEVYSFLEESEDVKNILWHMVQQHSWEYKWCLKEKGCNVLFIRFIRGTNRISAYALCIQAKVLARISWKGVLYCWKKGVKINHIQYTFTDKTGCSVRHPDIPLANTMTKYVLSI